MSRPVDRTPRINDGSRPSGLEIGRHAAGEADLPATHLTDPAVRARLEAIAKASPPAFDADALRARAAALPADDPVARWPPSDVRDEPSSRGEVVPFLQRVVVPVVSVLAVAATALLMLRDVPDSSSPDDPDSPNRVKGDADLDFFMLREGTAQPGDASRPVREGDQIQFSYRGAYDRLVIVGIDGDGAVMPYYPDIGEAPVAIVPGERRVLDGSILLDDAPGPEVFVAFFGESSAASASGSATSADPVADAMAAVREAWAVGGVEAIRRLDAERPDVAALVLDKE